MSFRPSNSLSYPNSLKEININSVVSLLKRADQLKEISDTAVLDVELLLSHALDVDRAWLKTWPEHEVLSAQLKGFEELFARRLTGEPIAFIIGSQGFWSLDLKVTPQTLIPRPETELLVETALDLKLPADCRAIDLGTGTGAICESTRSWRSGSPSHRQPRRQLHSVAPRTSGSARLAPAPQSPRPRPTAAAGPARCRR